MRFFFIALFALLSNGLHAQPQPTEYFAKHNDYRQVKISPTGEYFAATFLRDGKSVLATIDRSTMKPITGIFASDGGHIENFWWSGSDRLIYTIARKMGSLDFPVSSPELYGVDVDGKKHEIIFGYRSGDGISGSRIRSKQNDFASFELLSTLPGEEKNVLITEYPWHVVGDWWELNDLAIPEVYRLNTLTGKKKSETKLPVPNAYAILDSDKNPRFAVGVDKDRSAQIRYLPVGGLDWQPFSFSNADLNSLGIMGFGSSLQEVYLAATAPGGTTQTLFRLELDTGKAEPAFNNELVDPDWFIEDLETEAIVGVRFEPGKPQYHYFNPDNRTAVLHQKLSQAFAGHGVRFSSATRDGREIVVFVDSDQNPGDYYLFNTDTQQASYLFSRRSWVDPKTSRTMEPISLSARDGTPLHGYLVKPASGNGPFPLVVIPHGGPHYIRDQWLYDDETQLLADRGFAVLRVNFRGSGGYGDAFLRAGFGEWGKAMIDDITDSTRWAIEQSVTTEDKVCIYGASYGGYAALMSVIREPNLYQCAVSYVGVTDLPTFLNEQKGKLRRSTEAYLEQVLGENENELAEQSPLNHVAKIQVPLFIAHGGDDSRVPLKHAEMLKEELDKNSKPYEWLVFDDEGHGFWKVEHRVEYYDQLTAFLKQHLMP